MKGMAVVLRAGLVPNIRFDEIAIVLQMCAHYNSADDCARDESHR